MALRDSVRDPAAQYLRPGESYQDLDTTDVALAAA